MLRKLTTKSTMQNVEVAERTAHIGCSAHCKMVCNSVTDPEAYYFDYQELYSMIQG